MGGSLKLRKVFGLKPKSSSANLQPQPITPDNFNSNDLNANGIYSNNGGYHSYTPNGSSAFSSNNSGQAPGLSSISELPANEYGNGYTHHAPPQHQGQQHHRGHDHNRMSLPVQARPGPPNPQYPHDPNAYYQHHDRSSGNLSPQDAVHQSGGNRDRRSASLGSRLSLSNFGSTSSNSSLGRSSVTTLSTMSSAATSPGPGPGPASPHHLSHTQSQGYLAAAQPNSPRYPGQPVHGQGHGGQPQPQEHEQAAAKHRNFTNPLSSSRHRTTGSQQYPPQTQTQTNVLHKHEPAVQPPYPVSERGSPPPHGHSRSSGSHSQNLQSFAHRTSLHPGIPKSSSNSHPTQPQPHNQTQTQAQQQTPSAADIRRTTKLLRRMFELRLEQWALSHSHESDQHLVHEKRGQVDAVLADILGNVRSWGTGGRENWTEEEWDDVCLVRDVLGEMSAPGAPGGLSEGARGQVRTTVASKVDKRAVTNRSGASDEEIEESIRAIQRTMSL
ncbi:hypothetical protein B0H65DRAFT_575020 [Neurospora tetraspora]|uniref:Uncharacterized protein n=1 Tax=Neurospora tetraspora TaxID=94610 RepID=A0AAE0JHF7_9PEZI|nr:hypothetical protein B0H65DRAFT_575020 [Neurospora tetraspora]